MIRKHTDAGATFYAITPAGKEILASLPAIDRIIDSYVPGQGAEPS